MPTIIQYIALVTNTNYFPPTELRTLEEQIEDIRARTKILARIMLQSFRHPSVHLMDPNVIVVVVAPEFFFRGGALGYYIAPETAEKRGHVARLQFIETVQKEIAQQLPSEGYEAQIILFPGTIPIMTHLRPGSLHSTDTKKIENIAPIFIYVHLLRSWIFLDYVAKQFTSSIDFPYIYRGSGAPATFSVILAKKHDSIPAKASGLLHARGKLFREPVVGAILDVKTSRKIDNIKAEGTVDAPAFHAVISPYQRYRQLLERAPETEQRRLRQKIAAKYGIRLPHGGMFQTPILGDDPPRELWWNLQVCLDYRESQNRYQWEGEIYRAHIAGEDVPAPDISILTSAGMDVHTGSRPSDLAGRNLVRHNGLLFHCDGGKFLTANIYRNIGTIQAPDMQTVRNAVNTMITVDDAEVKSYYSDIQIIIFNPVRLIP